MSSIRLVVSLGPFQLGPVDEPIEVSNEALSSKLSENHFLPTDSMNTGCLEVHTFPMVVF